MINPEKQKRLEAADADLRSLRGELGRLLGPFTRKDATVNDQIIVAVGKLLQERDDYKMAANAEAQLADENAEALEAATNEIDRLRSAKSDSNSS